MSGKGESGEAMASVQVVRLGEGERRYELDEAALRRLLLRPDVRDLPAVVLSVAGAYRGGKSFILDFFLRYLNAPRSSQLSGEWLGKEDDRLKGFHWRGGGERDTTGIHLWPEPIITTLENGEKVAVLLMDTQGTFDSESTIGQNSTIFALSTLMSSVQVYNLSGNIKEDDLQHLQLFTEYGKLACEAQGKAFQTLTFLVRDWMSPYEHAHGFMGGAALLNKRLESKPNQKAELRDVREHVRSCFEEIKCFLMPHPGQAIENQCFSGCLRDLTEKFRLALLELVPSLFDPKYLTPKLINGERVRTQDLLGYLQKYVDIFNSDEVPEAVTIFKATADACLLAATRAARSLYAARMEERTRGARSVCASTLAAAHAAARLAAELCYKQKKKLGSQEDADAQLAELIKELEASLTLYQMNNDAMVREAMSLAKKAYDEALSSVCKEHARLCLHPDDLMELHGESLETALAHFDSTRDIPEDEVDDQRATLVQSLEQQYNQLCAINEQNNKSAVLEARNVYVTRMKVQRNHSGVSSDKLEALNRQAIDDAVEFLTKQRNRVSQHQDDTFVDKLLEEISGCFADFEKENINSNTIAMQAAEFAYNNHITSAWGPQMCCFHPLALFELHDKAMEVAMQQFLANREECEVDDFKAAVVKNLGLRLMDLQTINEFNNEMAVEQAFMLYTMKMDKHTRPSVLSLLVVPFFVKLLALLPAHHETAKQIAIAGMLCTMKMVKHTQPTVLSVLSLLVVPFFVNLLASLPEHHESSKQIALGEFKDRRRGCTYEDDKYYNALVQKMDVAYVNYRSPVLAILRELGVNVD